MRLLKHFETSKGKFVAVVSAGVVLTSAAVGYVGLSSSNAAVDTLPLDEDGQGGEQRVGVGAWSERNGLSLRVNSHRAFRHEQSDRLLLEVEVDFQNRASNTFRLPRQWFDLTDADGRVLEAEQLLQRDATGRLVVEPDEDESVKVLFWLGPAGVVPAEDMVFGVHQPDVAAVLVELPPLGAAI